jgi:hypothetical protein
MDDAEEEATADAEEKTLTGWWRKHGDQTDPDMRRALMWADWLDLPDDTMMLRAIYAAWAAGCQMNDPESRERARNIALRAGYGEIQPPRKGSGSVN